ncbi:MAG: hypothetical protein M5U31_04815 [Acidimicrobiia bacterium]|nr:hypothetical protein [Acidimicrobiia bacterium]
MTNDFEKRVQRQFNDEVGNAPPAPELWDRTQERIAQRSRRTRIGALATVLLVALATAAGITALSQGDDGARVAADPGDDMTGFVALTLDGQLRRYAPDGSDHGLVAETGWQYDEGDDLPPLPGFSVSSEPTVYFARPVQDPSCAVDAQLGSEIVSVPLEGGDPEVVAPVGTAPAVSPDGRELAFITTRSGEQCDSVADTQDATHPGSRTVALFDLESGEQTLLDIAYPDPLWTFSNSNRDPSGGFNPEGPIAWSPSGTELATNIRCAKPGPDCENYAVRVSMPASGGEARFLGIWGEGQGGPSLAFADDTSVLIDTGETINGDWIGLVDSAGLDPISAPDADTMIQEFIDLPHNAQLLSLSTLPGENSPGILVTTAPDRGASTGSASIYDGHETAPSVVVENVMGAVWIPGTTADDLPAEPIGTVKAAELAAEIPIDTAYLPGVGSTKMLAADDAGAWVIVGNDPDGASTGAVHVSAETGLVDDAFDQPGISSLLMVDDDLWFTSDDGVGRIRPDGTLEELGGSGNELAATDSKVWSADPVDDRVASFDRESGELVETLVTSDPPQEIVALGDDLWMEADDRSLARVDQGTGQLMESVGLPDRFALTYAVAGGTIWTIDSAGRLVPLVGVLAEAAPIPTGLEQGVLTPRDDGLAVTQDGDSELRLFDESGQPESEILDVPVVPFPVGADGPWGGMVISGDTAWWQNALEPSLLRIDLVE